MRVMVTGVRDDQQPDDLEAGEGVLDNDIQIRIEKRRKFKFVRRERVWLQVRDHYL